MERTRLMVRPAARSGFVTKSVGVPGRAARCGGRGFLRRRTRRGAAVVELAIVTPLLLLMMFGIMEFGWALMMRESILNACRESCRVRVLRGSTNTDAMTRFTGAVQGTGVTISPSQVAITSTTQANGDTVFTVTATVPRSQISLFGLSSAINGLMGFFSSDSLNMSSNVVVSCSMRGES